MARRTAEGDGPAVLDEDERQTALARGAGGVAGGAGGQGDDVGRGNPRRGASDLVGTADRGDPAPGALERAGEHVRTAAIGLDQEDDHFEP